MSKQRRKITAKKNMSAEEQEKVLSQLHKKDISEKLSNESTNPTSKGKKVQRVTIDFPLEIYEQMKVETEEKGHTLKWFIVNLVKKHLADS